VPGSYRPKPSNLLGQVGNFASGLNHCKVLQNQSLAMKEAEGNDLCLRPESLFSLGSTMCF
jgi:hypothetical protein